MVPGSPALLSARSSMVRHPSSSSPHASSFSRNVASISPTICNGVINLTQFEVKFQFEFDFFVYCGRPYLFICSLPAETKFCLLQIFGGGSAPNFREGGVCLLQIFGGGMSAPNFGGGGVCSKFSGGVSAPNFRGLGSGPGGGGGCLQFSEYGQRSAGTPSYWNAFLFLGKFGHSRHVNHMTSADLHVSCGPKLRL